MLDASHERVVFARHDPIKNRFLQHWREHEREALADQIPRSRETHSLEHAGQAWRLGSDVESVGKVDVRVPVHHALQDADGSKRSPGVEFLLDGGRDGHLH
eukprot:3932430-Rhodomonas_salina.1